MLNNKGFAISTMLYGLLIVIVLIVSLLMSTMSFTRKASKEFNETIVDQLEAKKTFTQDSSTLFDEYHNQCLSSSTAKVNATCESNCESIITFEMRNCCLDICGSDTGNCYIVCSKN